MQRLSTFLDDCRVRLQTLEKLPIALQAFDFAIWRILQACLRGIC